MNQKHKIIVVANTTWNIYNFRQNVLQILIDNGFEVIVLAPVDQYIIYQNSFPTVRHIPLKWLARKSLNFFKDVRLVLEFARIYKQEQPNMILHYTIKPNIYGGLAASYLGIPYICAVTGLGYTFLHNGFVYLLSRFLYKMAFKGSQKVIFENIDDRLLFNELGIVSLQKSLSVKGCGINTRHFKPDNSPFHTSDSRVFCFIGRFLYDKGILEFFEAARIVKKIKPNTQFWLVGEIDTENPSALDTDELQSWIDSKIITYHGATADVRPFIRQSDCIVCPSYREAIPRVVQEGMAMEKSIITTDVAGCREAVEDGQNGYLVPVKSIKELADAMLKITEHTPEQLLKMGKKSRQKVETEFDERLIAQHYLAVIKETLA